MTETAPAGIQDAAVRTGLAEIFAELADLFGNPRSHGLIYGLLFSSGEPLCMEDIARELGISRASVCQGLQVLEELGVVERHMDGRTGKFAARLELRRLIQGFVSRRLIPRLESSREKLLELREAAAALPAPEAGEARWRIERVLQWHNRASQFLPIAESLISKFKLPN
ncbi:MAG: helix-turn-helix domain-containing protein [Terrimicrobiaceae bacterium]|nr:helix-turn-helix domain-containing protein [Terrimicrobiaceae bacterium]